MRTRFDEKRQSAAPRRIPRDQAFLCATSLDEVIGNIEKQRRLLAQVAQRHASSADTTISIEDGHAVASAKWPYFDAMGRLLDLAIF
jgi:hypothetical protein